MWHKQLPLLNSSRFRVLLVGYILRSNLTGPQRHISCINSPAKSLLKWYSPPDFAGSHTGRTWSHWERRCFLKTEESNKKRRKIKQAKKVSIIYLCWWKCERQSWAVNRISASAKHCSKKKEWCFLYESVCSAVNPTHLPPRHVKKQEITASISASFYSHPAAQVHII